MKCRIVEQDGNKVFDIDGKIFAPAAFRSFRPTPANILQFYNSGVRLFQMIVSGRKNALGVKYSLFGETWVDSEQYDFSAFDKQMEMFIRIAPDGYFCVMIQLDAREWFIEKNKCPDSFRSFGKACFYEQWKKAAAAYLKAFIEYAEEKYGDKIFSYSFSAGWATEWFTRDMGEYDEKKEEYFKGYLKDKNAKIPSESDINRIDDEFLREKKSVISKYFKFSAENTAETICYFAKKAQEVLQHKKIIGLFYGYMLTDSIKHNRWGTAMYERVWQCKDIDMIFSPAAYRQFRLTENPAAYQVAVDSININNKLYMHEIDHRTHLAKFPLENGLIIQDGYDTEEETIMVLRRELCQMLQKGSALWWFDFFGGYYFTENYDKEIKKAVQIIEKMNTIPRKSISEVAVFYDSESFIHINGNLGIKEDYVHNIICEIAKSGVLYDIYNLNDINKVDMKQYKMIVFLGAFNIKPDIEQEIKMSEAYKVWIHAPMYENNRDINDVCEIVGMELSEMVGCDKVTFGDCSFGFSNEVKPIFEVKNADKVLANYSGSDKVAIAIKNRNIYSAVGNVPYQVWHEFEKISGVHIYNKDGVAVYGDSRFIAMQNPFSQKCELNLPANRCCLELFDDKKYNSDKCVLQYEAKKGETKLFLFE